MSNGSIIPIEAVMHFKFTELYEWAEENEEVKFLMRYSKITEVFFGFQRYWILS